MQARYILAVIALYFVKDSSCFSLSARILGRPKVFFRSELLQATTVSPPTAASEATPVPPETPDDNPATPVKIIAPPSMVLNPYYQRLASAHKYGPHLSVKGKVINLWGLVYVATVFSVALCVLPVMAMLAFLEDLMGNSMRRRTMDWIIHWWAKASLMLSCGNRTKLYGAENLPSADEAVVYVPNHTSFFDILVLSGFVPRPFKYLSKSEILDIPLVGQGMKLAKHVFLKRNDLQSTIECGETVKQRLLDGNSMVLFAEGTRSIDGKLKRFKKGAFQMAKEAGCRVVPVSIGNLHRWMPTNCLMPIGPIRHTYIKIHPAIETEGRKIKDIKKECFEAVNSGLPPYQKYES